MMCWKVYRSERNLISVISSAILSYNRLSVSCLHTSLSHTANNVKNSGNGNQPDTGNEKLDIFVHKIRLRNSRSTKLHSDSQPSLRSGRFANVKARTSVNKRLIAENSIRTPSVKDETQISIQNYALSKTESVTKVSSQKRPQSISVKDKNSEKNTLIVKDTLLSKSRLEKIGVEHQSDRKKDSLENIDSKGSSSSCVDNNEVYGYSKCTENNRVTIPTTYPTFTSTKSESVVSLKKDGNKGAFRHLGRLTKDEQTALQQVINSGRPVEALSRIEDYVRQNHQVPFGLLRCFCGVACTSGLVDEVMRVKKIAEKSHPHLYKKWFCLDNYLASALCYSGDFVGSLDMLILLYQKHPQGSKKIKDTAAHVIFNIMKTDQPENEQMVLKFVTDLAEKQNVLSPALALWRVGFCSTLYRQRKIAEGLVETHPGLIELLPQKLGNIIHSAYRDADLELLHRTFELLLLHEIKDYYSAATSALLQYQCDVGDLAGANQTLKFAHTLRVQLKPSQIQRLLVVLYHQRQPAPLLLLEMKYRLPPKPSPPRPPEFQYKF